MQGSPGCPIRPRTCPSLLGHCCCSDLLCVLCVVAHCLEFRADFGTDSIALRRTFIVSTLLFVVACAPPAGRKSDGTFPHTRALDDSDPAIYTASYPRSSSGPYAQK